MRKIPTIFIRDMTVQPTLVTPEWHTQCLWVKDGEGVATVKYDGYCTMLRDGVFFKRREIKGGSEPPIGFEEVDSDIHTDKVIGWVPVGLGPEDQWLREALQTMHEMEEPLLDGTYEAIGRKIQGNKNAIKPDRHLLVRHGKEILSDAPREFEELRTYIRDLPAEGIVWHHPDGRMAKIKRRDYGYRW